MNGVEKLYYCKNAAGFIYLTSPKSPVKPGFIRYSTTIPAEMDKVFKTLDEQTRRDNAQLTYELYLRRKESIDKWRSDIRSRMVSVDCSDAEREILRAALSACDAREEKLNRNSVHGVSAMQTTEANPKAAGDNQVFFLPPSETIQ